MNCKNAITKAKRLATSENKPCTVWKCGDEFVALFDNAEWPLKFKHSNLPIKPVVQYDPEETHYLGRMVLSMHNLPVRRYPATH
jgi:hypothetical protein